MDYVLRRERQLDSRILGHVQFVDLAPAFRMLDFPHPLLPNDVHVLSALRRRLTIHIYLGAPDEHDERNEERHGSPKQLQPG